jgi:polar amino acid transport system substrate-binding protein
MSRKIRIRRPAGKSPWIVIEILLVFVCVHAPENILAQDEKPLPVLVTGVWAAPPLCMKIEGNQWGGFSVDVWKAVAETVGFSIEFREFADIEAMMEAFHKKEIDVLPSVIVQERFESVMDYSQSYLKSGLSIAVPAEGSELRWMRIFEGFTSAHILKAIGFMIFVSLVAGVIVWAFERHRNSDMFGEGVVKGIGHGIWWAMVTMTTVGYGDKSPRTFGGRLVALIWMIFSLVFIASFTANITTSLTLEDLKGKVRGFNDLYNARVGSLSGSTGADFLARQGITVIPFKDFQEGLRAVAEKRIDAFVQDEHVLKYQARKDFPGRVQVLPGHYDEYFVSIALQENSPLRKPINKALLRFMASENWTGLVNRYSK